MTFIKAAIVYFIFLFAFYSKYSAQKLKFENYTTSEGLLSDEVYNLHQDKNGYIWLFTNYGALKYNGQEFKQVLTNLPFNESFIYCIYENAFGKKWVANSNAKIFEIRNDSAFQVKGIESASEDLKRTVSEIAQLHVDDSLNILAMTKHYCHKFIKTSTDYKVIKSSHNRNDSILMKVYSHSNANNNYLFYTTNFNGNDTTYCSGIENIKMLIQKKNGFKYVKINCSSAFPKHFKRYHNYTYFIHHLKIIKIDTNQQLSYLPFKTPILNYVKDKNNHLWVGCYNDGLYELNEKDSIINHYFQNISINDVLIDSQNGIWASSSGKGLFYCSNQNDYYFDLESELGKPISWIKKIENELFVTNSIGDVFKIRNNNITHFTKHNKPEELLDFIKIEDKYILFHRFNQDYSWFYPLKNNSGQTLTAFKSFAIHKDTLVFLNRKNLNFIVKGNVIKTFSIHNKASALAYRKGSFLIGTEDGLYELKNNNISQPASLKQTKGVKIKNIYCDSFYNFWICSTGEGIYKLDLNDQLRQYSVLNGLPGNIINNIDFNDSVAFLSTNIGLFYAKMKKNTLDSLSWKKLYSGFVDNALFFENKIYVATKKGLVILDNTKLNNLDKIYFNTKSIKVNENEIPIQKITDLSYTENNLEFVFDIITFKNEKYSLKYYLKGTTSDSDIVETGNLAFKKLSPGNYNLIVYPLVPDGEKLKLEFEFYIKPAFWQTKIFLIVLSLAILILIVLSIWLLFNSFKRRNQKKVKAERLILEYKLIALKAQINPHFMSNCLSAIQNLLMNNKLVEATNYLAKFGHLVRHILNFSTRSFVTLAEELEIAALNITLEQLRFENKFEYNLKIDETIDPKKMFVPALILNPIIENAIWHGLLPLKNKRAAKLLIEVSHNSEVLFIKIRDNGVGRIMDNLNVGNIHESKGIKLTEQRLSNINYMYEENISTIVYTDLYDKISNRAGTEVVITIPKTLNL